jgi:hypothetical protein
MGTSILDTAKKNDTAQAPSQTSTMTSTAAAAAAAAAPYSDMEGNAGKKTPTAANDTNAKNRPPIPTPIANHFQVPPPTYQQSHRLRKLMQRHYQVLVQQAILSIRMAQQQKNPLGTMGASSTDIQENNFFLSGENENDLVEVLDLAVGMLQDLDQNRKDAIRTSILLAVIASGYKEDGTCDEYENEDMEESRHHQDDDTNSSMHQHYDEKGNEMTDTTVKGRRSLVFGETVDPQESKDVGGSTMAVTKSTLPPPCDGSRRLTRAAFQRLQAQPNKPGTNRTAFDIPGLLKLQETFSTIDKSVVIFSKNSGGQNTNGNIIRNKDSINKQDVSDCNILMARTHAQACQSVLKESGANVEESLLPGTLDLSDNFTSMEDVFDDSFQPPCTPEQEVFLRKNRNLFTSGEDNLVLRGVNLYGEKQWILISDRYLPDRSVNIISQRYSKLCVMIYRAHGIYIDEKGNLQDAPRLESVDDIDESKVRIWGLKPVEPPAILNVHRWSLDEDLTLLKAVPIMGHM